MSNYESNHILSCRLVKVNMKTSAHKCLAKGERYFNRCRSRMERYLLFYLFACGRHVAFEKLREVCYRE